MTGPGTRSGPDAGPDAGAALGAGTGNLPEVITALGEHRARTARLLAFLDELQAATDACRLPVPGGDQASLSTLLSQFGDRLRTTDGALQRLSAQLSAASHGNGLRRASDRRPLTTGGAPTG